VFKEFVEQATQAYKPAKADGSPDDAPPYLLVIDEINRGNLAQIFGETITLLEQDKRLGAANETPVQLPHSGKSFVLPPNVFVIGTMNTADRSIALVDAALRRRFRFVHFPPAVEVLCDTYGYENLPAKKVAAEGNSDRADQLLALSVCAFERLNQAIRSNPDLGRGKQLGHTIFMGPDQSDSVDERLRAIRDQWKYELMPLLEEYYFGQFDRIDQELFDGVGSNLIDTSSQEIRDFTPADIAVVCAEIIPDIEADIQWARGSIE